MLWYPYRRAVQAVSLPSRRHGCS